MTDNRPELVRDLEGLAYYLKRMPEHVYSENREHVLLAHRSAATVERALALIARIPAPEPTEVRTALAGLVALEEAHGAQGWSRWRTAWDAAKAALQGLESK